MSIAEIKGRHDSYERAIPTGCFGIESHKDRGELLAMLAKYERVIKDEINRIQHKKTRTTPRTTAEIAAELEEKSIKADAAKERKAYRLANPKPPRQPTLTHKLRYETLVKYNSTCLLCGARPGDGLIVEVDHIKPVSKYPELVNDPDNLQVLCEICNSGKSNRTEDDFRSDTP